MEKKSCNSLFVNRTHSPFRLLKLFCDKLLLYLPFHMLKLFLTQKGKENSNCDDMHKINEQKQMLLHFLIMLTQRLTKLLSSYSTEQPQTARLK